MALRKPFRGKLPAYSRTVGGQSPQIDAANQNRALEDIQREALRGQEHSDITPSGQSVQGNLNDNTVAVTFKKANAPQFVAHGLGHVCYNWTIVGKKAFGDVCEPGGKTYKPTKNGIWLMSNTDNLSVRIRIDGQKGND